MVLAFIFNFLAYICVRKLLSKVEIYNSNQLGLNMTQKINLCREYERVFCVPSQLRPRLLAVMKTPEAISLRRAEVLRRSAQNLVMELRRRSLTSAITQEKSQKKTVPSIKKVPARLRLCFKIR